MNFVNEQNISRLQICQERSEISGAGKHRAGGGAKSHAKFARHDLRQCRFAKTRRAGKQDMIQGFPPRFCGLDKDRNIGARLCLADKFR